MAERVTILGAGQMGLVLADALVQGGSQVRLWGPHAEHVESLARTRRVPHRLPDFELPAEVEVTASDSHAAADAQWLLNAVPAQYIRGVWQRMAAHLPASPVICVAKGVETGTLLRPSEVLHEVLSEQGRPPICALSGPTIAAELAERLPATMVAAAEDLSIAERVQKLFDAPWLRVYRSDDLAGVELAGATKNVIALAAGMVDGLGIGANAKSALLARGLAEITRLGQALGARMETFFGVAGVGDLATTCFSPHGRNRTCGERLGRGETLADILASTVSVVEGIATTKSVTTLAQRHDVDMPITRAVHAILFDDLPAREAIRQLMSRQQKAEWESPPTDSSCASASARR